MIFHSANTERRLEIPAVLERVCVRPPYFALFNLSISGSVLKATARAETRIANETGPMSAAELGRHAAIAGTCCAAMKQADSKRRYYLAQQAECTFFDSGGPFGVPVNFRSEVLELTKRQMRALINAEVDHRPVAEFDISYTVLTAETFQRLFDWRSQATPEVENPYRRLLPATLTQGDSWSKMTVEEVPVAACAGHFQDYPALPVAILMGRLSELAGRMVDLSPVPYRVVRGSIGARDLVWAGERAEFVVENVATLGSQKAFDCKVLADGRSVATMTLVLEPI